MVGFIVSDKVFCWLQLNFYFITTVFFCICVYWLQPVIHHLGIQRDFTFDPIYQFIFRVLGKYLDGKFWSVTEFNFLWILLEMRGRYS
jgi:hypothetical protein